MTRLLRYIVLTWCFGLTTLSAQVTDMVDYIEVLGDIEGMWGRFDSFVRNSSGLSWDGDKLLLASNAKFVFLGDAQDRGPNSMKIMDTLISLKERYGERVTLIVGNRDLNKIVFGDTSIDFVNSPDKIKTILAERMNAASAFEFRRQELEEIKGAEVTNKEVAISFVEDAKPQGRLARYLNLAQLIHFDVETKSLFIHGGLHNNAVGNIPVEKYKDRHSLSGWIKDLNDWYQKQLLQALSGNNMSRRNLISYGGNPKGVVYSRFTDSSGNSFLPTGRVRKFLLDSKVVHIFAGHTPVGEIPAVIAEDKKLRLILADTSYSEAEISAIIKVNELGVIIKGIFRGKPTMASLPRDVAMGVGRLVKEKWRIIASLRDGSFVGLSVDKKEVYTNNYKVIEESDATQLGTCFSLLHKSANN